MPPETLEFEEPVAAVLKEIEALNELPRTDARDRQIETLQRKVQTVRADRSGQIQVVVDDERNTRFATEGKQRRALLAALRGIRGFVAVLQDPRSTGKNLAHFASEQPDVGLIGRHGVQTAKSPVRNHPVLRLCLCLAHPFPAPRKTDPVCADPCRDETPR